MILVVANRFDATADELVARWAGPGPIDRTTARELLSAGWTFDPRSPGRGTYLTRGGPRPVRDLRGVLVLTPWIGPEDIADLIRPEDRLYACQEAAAFLAAWLAALSCPVVNRPRPDGLAGPSWRSDRWAVFAEGHGIPAARLARRVPRAAVVGPAAAEVVVVGGTTLSAASDRHRAVARTLAGLVGARLLRVDFDGSDAVPRVIRADPLTRFADRADVVTGVVALLAGFSESAE